VKRTERLAEATAPDGSRLSLLRHDRDYILRVNGADLMSTRRHASEDALAGVACAPLGAQPSASVLIGGLGLGFTLRAALALLAPDARVVVAEIVQAVIDWNRDPAYELAADALDDPRVEIRRADVADLLRASRGAFDAIMLDVDNGAEALTTADNARLYDDDGIRLTIAALRPRGRIVYWSAQADRAFERSLRHAGLTVESVPVRAHGKSGGHHTLLVARAG
jgi:spermidine synthase